MAIIAFAMGQGGTAEQAPGGFAALMPLILLIITVTKGWLFARIARAVRRSYGLYFVLGMFPVTDFIALVLLGNERTISCPQCAEVIKEAAKKCRHCGEVLHS